MGTLTYKLDGRLEARPAPT